MVQLSAISSKYSKVCNILGILSVIFGLSSQVQYVKDLIFLIGENVILFFDGISFLII